MNKLKRNLVYYISVFVTLFVVFFGLFFPSKLEKGMNASFSFLVNKLGWFYILSMSVFVLFSIFLIFSKWRNIRLGKDDDRPEYSFISWFAMLFSAGMGIGLVFYGVSEPIYHYLAPLNGTPGSQEAVHFAMQKSFLHWGLHPWSGYVLIGGALAYMNFRKDKPALISSLLIPIFGEKHTNGYLGKSIDILAIFATVAGITTSLGLGAYQINAGLNYLFGIPISDLSVVLIVLFTTGMFILSAVSGLDRGIKILSNTNIGIAFLIMVLTIIVGPSLLMLTNFGIGIKEYLINLPKDMLPLDLKENASWYGSWTIFYWAWWIAWAPFVGTFIARISKGRTIKEFVLGVLLAPVLASFVWFAIFGTAGMNLGVESASDATSNLATSFFIVMENYKLGGAISLITVILLFTFFVTSADSGTFVLAMFSSDGNLHPTTVRKVVWGILIAFMALALMLASDRGLNLIQTASIVAAFPFAIIMLLTIVAWIKSLIEEKV